MACKRDDFADFGVYHVFVEEGWLPDTLFVPSQNKKKMCNCAGPEALKIDLYSRVYTSRCLFSVAAKDGPLPLAPFPPSCHHKRGFWPTSGTAQLPQFNPNLKDRPNSFMFFL